MSIRPVKRIVQAQPTLEGAGVHLRRAFGLGIQGISIRFFCLTTSGTNGRKIILQVSRGILTAGLRR